MCERRGGEGREIRGKDGRTECIMSDILSRDTVVHCSMNSSPDIRMCDDGDCRVLAKTRGGCCCFLFFLISLARCGHLERWQIEARLFL